MSDDLLPLTNEAAADRLRALLHQIEDEPPLGPLLVHTLTPTPEETAAMHPKPERTTRGPRTEAHADREYPNPSGTR